MLVALPVVLYLVLHVSAVATFIAALGAIFVIGMPLIVDSGNTFNSNSVVAGALGSGLCGPSSSFPGCGGAPGTAGSGSDGGPGGVDTDPATDGVPGDPGTAGFVGSNGVVGTAFIPDHN